MNSILNPYISFKDNALEAMTFYHSVLGGEFTHQTFKEGHADDIGPEEEGLLMHAMIKADNGITLMGADTPKRMMPNGEFHSESRISISLSGDNEEELTGYYNKLSEGGKLTMPMAKAPWGDSFGMFTDKYGVDWMVNITTPKKAE